MKTLLIPTMILLCSLSSFGASAGGAIAPIRVQPEFRQTPMWYWQSPEKKCVGVPAYDVISRIAPARIREAHFSEAKPRCEIKLDTRQIVAALSCEGQLLTEYFSNEHLCKEKLGIKEASLR